MKKNISNAIIAWIKKVKKPLILVLGTISLGSVLSVAIFIGFKENQIEKDKRNSYIEVKLDREAQRIDKLASTNITALDKIYKDSLSINRLKINKIDPEFIYQINNNEILKSQNTEVQIKIISKNNPNKFKIASRKISIEIFNSSVIKGQEDDFKAVQKEVDRISQLPILEMERHTSIAGNSLQLNDLNLGKMNPKLNYLVFNNDIFHNGTSFANIFISLNSIVIDVKREIKVRGLDSSLSHKKINKEKDRIEALSKLRITKVDKISSSDLTLNNLDLGTLDSDINYSVKAKDISASGDENIEIDLSLKGDSTVKAVAFRSISSNIIDATNLSPSQKELIEDALNSDFQKPASDLKNLNHEKNRIENLAPLLITRSNPISGNTLKVNDLSLGNQISGAKYIVFNSDINKDGLTNVTIFITLNGLTVYTERQINVVGIDSNTKQQKINKEKARIEALSKLQIIKADQISSSDLTLNNLDLGTLDSDINYSVKAKDISASGDENIEIDLSLKNDRTFKAMALRPIYANIINTTNLSPKQKELIEKGISGGIQKIKSIFSNLNAEVDRINNLSTLEINKENPIPGNTLKLDDLSLSSTLAGADYKFFHNDVNSDEKLGVDVLITIDDLSVMAKREINVLGIDAHKASQKLEKEKSISDLRNEVKRIESLSPLPYSTNKTFLRENYFNATNLHLTEIPGATYKFENDLIDQDGIYKVFISISFDQNNSSIFGYAVREVNVTGIDAAIVKEKLDKEVKRINNLPSKELRTVGDVLPNSLKLDNLDIGQKLSNANYEAENSLIENNCDYEVNIIITLDGQTQTAKRKIKVVFREWKKFADSPLLDRWGDAASLAYGAILQDSRGNIWLMGDDTNLLVSRDGGNTFEEAKNNNDPIKGGRFKTIFEDSNQTLWVLTSDTGILYSTDGGITWNENSNKVDDLYAGSILQDSKGNIYIMGDGKLLISRDEGQTWQESTADITRGTQGKIFEDSKGNIWIIGGGAPLQFSSDYGNTWQKAEIEVTQKARTSPGAYSTIFEDSHNNLWVMGLQIPPQVLRNGQTEWTNGNTGIANGDAGVIIEDSNHILWLMTDDSKLKFSKDFGETWEDSNSGISGGSYGTIFEDSSGILWAAGDGNKMNPVISKNGGNSWQDSKILNGVISRRGISGTGMKIYEDNNENIWILCSKGLFKLAK